MKKIIAVILVLFVGAHLKTGDKVESFKSEYNNIPINTEYTENIELMDDEEYETYDFIDCSEEELEGKIIHIIDGLILIFTNVFSIFECIIEFFLDSFFKLFNKIGV